MDAGSERKAAVVSGVRGVGRARVRKFASAGYDVAVLARGRAGVDAAVGEVEAPLQSAYCGAKPAAPAALMPQVVVRPIASPMAMGFLGLGGASGLLSGHLDGGPVGVVGGGRSDHAAVPTPGHGGAHRSGHALRRRRAAGAGGGRLLRQARPGGGLLSRRGARCSPCSAWARGGSRWRVTASSSSPASTTRREYASSCDSASPGRAQPVRKSARSACLTSRPRPGRDRSGRR